MKERAWAAVAAWSIILMGSLWSELACTTKTHDLPATGAATADNRHEGEEGTMGKRDAKNRTGLHGLRGPVAGLSVDDSGGKGKRHKGESGADADALGALVGDRISEVHGAVGLGLVGTGSGGGTGKGYGRGAGHWGGHSATAFRARGARGVPVTGLDPDSASEPVGTEGYADAGVNPWTLAAKDRIETFAVDVDSASYTIARRKILEGVRPPTAAVRVEEFVNYFKYDYAGPKGPEPFAVHLEAAPSPFLPGRYLLRVGIKGRELSKAERKPAHLVFLVDTSGSMQSADKIDLVKRALRILVDNLQDGDTVALTTYAGSVRLVLEPTDIEEKARIHAAIEDLTASGSTAMASGLELAYEVASRTLDDASVTRVIVLSDGDANVGATSHEEILETIAGHVSEGVTLSAIGFGMGNYKDALMEGLANKGNGNYYYVDGISEARRIFQEQLGGTLEVIAKDVKIQVDFDPDAVRRYRLLGYENRAIADVDFRDDKVDAGEIGAGHRVTAVFEVELTDRAAGPLATVRLRHKAPRGVKATETAVSLLREDVLTTFAASSIDFRFAVAVAATAEILRRSPHAEGWTLRETASIAAAATAAGDAEREEFLELLARLRKLPAS